MELTTAWTKRLDTWLIPFLDALGDKRRRKWAPLYILGLLLPGDRKSMQPISARVAPKDEEQVHHFVATSCWDNAPVEEILCAKVDEMLGGADAFLIVDDTSLPKKGTKSVGVAHQYCGALGKQANCQSLVSLTLARDDVLTIAEIRRNSIGMGLGGTRERRASGSEPPDVLLAHGVSVIVSSCALGALKDGSEVERPAEARLVRAGARTRHRCRTRGSAG